MALEYWLKGDIPPGPIKATIVTDFNRVVEIIKKFKNYAVMLVGANIRTFEKTLGVGVVEILSEIAKTIGAPIITSDAATIHKLDELGFTNYKVMFPLEVIQKLSKGDSHYKLTLLVGFRYSYGWLLLNHLKHYRPDIQTLSIDPYAQPNATWTMPSLPLQLWFKNLSQIVEILKSSTT